jgi:hypothetical protein
VHGSAECSRNYAAPNDYGETPVRLLGGARAHRGKGKGMSYKFGGLFRAYCTENGELDEALIRKVFKKDAKLDAAEKDFWLLHNHNPDFGTVN